MASWWLALLAAPFAGSLLFVLVRRLPLENPALWGRSRCEACGRALAATELLPIVSYLVQRGKCRACGARISRSHLIAECLAIGVAGAVATTGADGAELWAGCALGWTLLALAWIDSEHYFLPDVLTLPLVLGGLGEAWLDAPWALTGRSFGAVAGYATFRVIATIYRRLRGRDGLGEGDAKLLAGSGAWLGVLVLPDIVLLAALIGLGMALAARWRGATLQAATAVPFGPALAAATFALWLAQAWLG